MLTDSILLDGYSSMYLIRATEQKLAKYYFDNKVMSFVHFCVGQEAVPVGVSLNLENDDKVFGNHRSHGHYLAKGGDLNKLISELLGKETGSCGGMGGSMHCYDKSVNFLGSVPILGSIGPIASGAALSEKIKNENNIVVCYYGDGASEEGVIYEAYNFAALFQLPVVFVIENNLYSVMTKIKDRRHNNYNLQSIVNGFGCEYLSANGNDFIDMYQKGNTAVNIARRECRPVVLECMVYRHMAHSAPLFDDNKCYREVDTPEVRAKEDSLIKLRQILVNKDFNLEVIESKINNIIDEAISFAVHSSEPPEENLYRNVFAE